MTGKVVVYARGMMMCSVCAPEAMTIEDVVAEVNIQYPSGTDMGWVKADDETFKGGEPIPCPCNKNFGYQHWLLEC